MNKSELQRVIQKNEIKRGDRILIVLRNGEVVPVRFVGLEEGAEDRFDLKMYYVFYDTETTEGVSDNQCPSYLLANIDAILPVRNIEELAKQLAELLKFLTKTKVILEAMLSQIFS